MNVMKPSEKRDWQDLLAKTVIRSGIYEHWKGGAYVVFGCSVMEATGVRLVHYYSILKMQRWTRSFEEWHAQSPEQAPDDLRPRFTFVREASLHQLIVAACGGEADGGYGDA